MNKNHEVNVIITCAWTGKAKRIKLEFDFQYHKSLESWWVHFPEGGVTGYESRECISLKKRNYKGWYACAGTKQRWDTMYIPARDMNKMYRAWQAYKKKHDIQEP